MRNFEDALNLVTFLSKELTKLEKTRKEILNSNLLAADKDERVGKVVEEIRKKTDERRQVLQDLVRFPPRHIQYAQQVEQFFKVAPWEKSVFIMTKYPDGKDPKLDAQLQRVIDAVRDAVTKSGFSPRLASENKYHPNLWENVEIYLLSCARGIAIVDERYKKDLNPNVAMEWGWMRAMGKPILYLVEKEAEIIPADVLSSLLDRRHR